MWLDWAIQRREEGNPHQQHELQYEAHKCSHSGSCHRHVVKERWWTGRSSHFIYVAKSVVESRIERTRFSICCERTTTSSPRIFVELFMEARYLTRFLRCGFTSANVLPIMSPWELMPTLGALSQLTDTLAITPVDKLTNMFAGLDSNGEWEVSRWMKQSTSL